MTGAIVLTIGRQGHYNSCKQKKGWPGTLGDRMATIGFDLAVVSADDILRYESGVATNRLVGLYNPHEPQLNAMQLMQASALPPICWVPSFILGRQSWGRQEGTRVTGVRTAQGQSFLPSGDCGN